MKAPFSRPNSSLSISVAGIAAQLTRTMLRPRAGCRLVNLGRQQLLAGAGLAQQQHRRIGRGDLVDLLEHPAHRRALANDGLGSERSALGTRTRPVEERTG